MIPLCLAIIAGLLLVIFGLLLRNRSATAKTTPDYLHSIPSQVAGSDLANYLGSRFVGPAADGSAIKSAVPNEIVWVDNADEVLVHLKSLVTQIAGECLLVSIDLETDQTGRTPLIVAFSLGKDEQGGLVAATDEFPRGNGLLAARWGIPVQQAAWNALLSLAVDHATERGATPHGLTIQNGMLQFRTGTEFKLPKRL